MIHRGIFWNHCLEDCYGPFPVPHDDVLFATRAYCLTQKDDIIQLPPEVKPFHQWISGHYAKVGLHVTQQIVWSKEYFLAERYTDCVPSVYFFGPKAHAIWPDRPRLETSLQYNNKLRASEAFAALDISANPPFINFHSGKGEINNLSVYDGVHNFVKGGYSVGGSLVFSCRILKEYQEVIAAIDPMMPLQFQKAIVQPDGKAGIPITLFYYINVEGPKPIVATQQILDGYSHAGNIYPTEHQPWEVTDTIIKEMHREGMRGHVAFNLIGIPQADGGFSYWIIECNPRWGGSAYYKYLGDILEVDSWCVKVFKTTKTDLNDLSLGNLTFDPQTKKGIVVINWGTILLGELQIFMAGEKADWSVIEQELGALL